MKSKYVVAAVALCLVIAGRSQAVITNWTVQSASSSLTIAGALSSGGTFLAAVIPQGPGSLTTTYGGTIETVSSLTGGVATDLAITDSLLVANNSGSWDPLPGNAQGTAPANYGLDINLGFLGGANLALRNLSLQLLAETVPLTGVPFAIQSFSADIDSLILSAVGDIRAYSIGAIPTADPMPLAQLSDNFLANGSISYGPGGGAGVATLTIPVEINFVGFVAGQDTTSTSDDIATYMSLMGNIVATAPTASVPEASSLALLGLAGSVVGFVGYRQKLKQIVN